MIDSLFMLRKLLVAAKEHRQVENEILALFAAQLAPQFRKNARNGENTLQYLQRNFFSSLFLSIYQAVGIPEETRLLYGMINHCVRGVVTGADNLLDQEYKELLPLNFPDRAIRFKSVMHILCFDRLLEQIVRQASDTGLIARQAVGAIHDSLFRALVPIGAEEAGEEAGITTVLTPSEIVRSIHIYKGGKLLCLAFVVPLLLEKELEAKLSLAERGIYKIGMALQVIDDITDLYEDLAAANHNYLVSAVYHEGDAAEKALLEDIRSHRDKRMLPVEVLFPRTLHNVMARAIGEAAGGFAELDRAGYQYTQTRALRVLRFLFQVRGVGRLLPFFPATDQLQNLS